MKCIERDVAKRQDEFNKQGARCLSIHEGAWRCVFQWTSPWDTASFPKADLRRNMWRTWAVIQTTYYSFTIYHFVLFSSGIRYLRDFLLYSFHIFFHQALIRRITWFSYFIVLRNGINVNINSSRSKNDTRLPLGLRDKLEWIMRGDNTFFLPCKTWCTV